MQSYAEEKLTQRDERVVITTGKRIPKQIGLAVTLGAIVGALLLLSSPGTSQAISFDLTAGGDFGSGGNPSPSPQSHQQQRTG